MTLAFSEIVMSTISDEEFKIADGVITLKAGR